jgi:hypothetical protein
MWREHTTLIFIVPAPKDCPEAIYKLMSKCWNDNPDQRPTFVEIYAQLQEIHKLAEYSQNSNNASVANNHPNTPYVSTGPMLISSDDALYATDGFGKDYVYQ